MTSAFKLQKLSFNLGKVTFNMLPVEGGTFQMGGTEFDKEKPIHQVSVPSFYIAEFLVTQALYKAVMGENPSYFKGRRQPVERVSWNDTKVFLEKLNSLKEVIKILEAQGLEKHHFCLPSEAEWEYAARGGKYSEGYTYAGSDDLKQVGWYDGNSNSETKPVGLLQPNELGLYDMSGNVFEWCEDDWHNSYSETPVDGSAWIDAPSRATNRVIRGGCYFLIAVHCRPAFRTDDSPAYRYYNIGFRLVLSPS